MAEARVVYVDAAARPACTAGDGSRGNPVCEIRDALPLAVGERDTIRVLPGSYLNFSVSARALRFFGPGADASLVGEEDLGAGVRITNGAQVLLDGLRFGQGVRNGISCC